MSSPLIAAAVISATSGIVLHYSRLLDIEVDDNDIGAHNKRTLHVVGVTVAAGLAYLFVNFLYSQPAPVRDSATQAVLEPMGGSRIKNSLARLMARISRFKETRKFAASSAAEHEAFHHAEPHPFFNESQ
jgi:hypothetical protein